LRVSDAGARAIFIPTKAVGILHGKSSRWFTCRDCSLMEQLKKITDAIFKILIGRQIVRVALQEMLGDPFDRASKSVLLFQPPELIGQERSIGWLDDAWSIFHVGRLPRSRRSSSAYCRA